MVTNVFRLALCAATLTAAATPVAAQTIDYGSLEQLFGEPVTSSATGKPQRVSDAPVTMNIISQADIRQSGATTIPDILQRVVGLDVWRFGTMSSDVAVRGLNSAGSPRLLVLINGRQVYEDHYGLTNWANLPVSLAEIRQIEVVKGPNTALFGFNAVGGVVNIVTYSPLTDKVSNATARIGTQGYRELSATHTVKLGDSIGVRLSAGGYNVDEFERGATATEKARFGDPSHRRAALDVQSQLTPDAQMRLEANAAESRRAQMVPGYTYLYNDEEVWSVKGTYTLNSGLGLIEATAYHTDLALQYPGFLEIDNKVTVARLQDLFKIGTAHSVRLAAEYRRNELELSTAPDATLGYDVYSASAMWDWAVNDRLSLVNAARIDRLELERSGPMLPGLPFTNDTFDVGMTEYSYNSGLVWKVTDTDTVRLTAARGIQTPSLFELGEVTVVVPLVRIGNPAIEPTIVTNYELAWDRTVSAIDGGLRLAAYHQINKDVKSAYRTLFAAPGLIVQMPMNVGRTEATGAEVSLNGAVGAGWTWQAGYAYETVDDDFDFAQQSVNFEDGTARHKLSGELTYAQGPFEANLFAQYVSAIDMLRSGVGLVEVPDYVYVAARLGYRVTDNVTVSVSAFNATQEEARLTSGLVEERRVYGTISVDF